MDTTSTTGSIRANSSRQELIRHEEYSGSVIAQTGPMVDYKPNNHGGEKGLGTPAESTSTEDFQRPEAKVTRAEIITVSILCFVNLINYMDRFTLAGILTDIQCFYDIGDTEGGLLQTAFILSYMVFAPLFGYLGDRYSRRTLMASGIFLWSLTTLLGSFADNFHWFISFRAMVGIGEASYSTIAPTIISDLFVKDTRSKMLALFYFAIPVGSGLGYIVGSEFAKLGKTWQWGLRVTPILGAVAVLLVLFVMRDPPRGESEGSHLKPTSWWADIKSLCKNRSFMLSTVASMCVAFVAGALAWWGPKFITLGLANQPGQENVSMDEISMVFGVIAIIAGISGVLLGSWMGQKLRTKFETADSLVCGFGLLLSVPFIYLAFVLAGYNTPATFAVAFFAQFFLNLNWAICGDILLVRSILSGVAYIFGVITMISGLVGVPLGSIVGQKLRTRYPRADPLVCAFGLLASTPLMLASMYMAPVSTPACFTLVFFGELFLNMNWAIVADILLYVVIPTRRATAEAFQILVSHAFGDAGSPYLIGQVSEILKRTLKPDTNLVEIPLRAPSHNASLYSTVPSVLDTPTTPIPWNCSSSSIDMTNVDVEFTALQYALFITAFVEVIGGAFFLMSAWYLVEDKAKVTRALQNGAEDPEPLNDTCHRRARLYAGDSTPEEEETLPALTS